MILILAVILLIGYMSLVWVWYRYTNNPSVVDVAWAFGLTWVGILFLSPNLTARSILFGLVLIIWGFRLGLYLQLTRIQQGKVDKRYLVLSEHWQMSRALGFFINFQFQGLLILLLSMPFYFAGQSQAQFPNGIEFFGIILALMGILFETISDQQLQRFKSNYPGQVCDTGLWQYSRHPNYFFEWIIWCGFCLFGLTHAYGWIGLCSPAILYWLMIYITAPLTEQESLKSRGEKYQRYQANTPMFFPNFRNRNDADFN